MNKKIIGLGLSFLIAASLLLASCSTSNSTSSKAASSTTSAGNWWSKFGTPQYGGQMNVRVNSNITSFDPYLPPGTSYTDTWMEFLVQDDWTLDPAVFPYNILFRPNAYLKGHLADSWEFTDPSTLVLHIHPGIHWQNIPPANGREFTAADVVFDYQRMYGLGSGMKPSPFWSTMPEGQYMVSVTATDKYTVVEKWKSSNPEYILETFEPAAGDNLMVNPEAVQQWGNLSDWHHAIGTGPFILQNFVSGDSMTLVKNPNYWGYDEHFPKNQILYIDQLNILIIPDNSTALAAMRTGKIDYMDTVSYTDAQSMQKTNSAILEFPEPSYIGTSLDMRYDLKPFTDIRVRQALQQAVDLPTIAKTYYGGSVQPYPLTLSSYFEKGYGFPYDQWPQELKDQYAYNPTAAKQLLAAAGYPNGFNTDIVVPTTSDMDLLQIVKSYFAAVGVNMDIRPLDAPSLSNLVRNYKTDAMCMWTSGQLGMTFEFSFQINEFTTGAGNNFGNVNDPVWNAFSSKAMAATSIADFKQVIQDANEYVARQHFDVSLVQPNTYNLCQPWLKGYNGRLFSNQTGFYAARFWVDQNLKKSSGY